VVELAKEAGIDYITLFGFSSENWARPEEEVDHLLDLLRHYLSEEIDELNESNVRLKVIGDIEKFPADLQGKIDRAEALTNDNDGIVVTIALSYGGRLDIVQAVQRLVRKAAEGDIRPEDISYDMIARHLLTADLPDPDMIVRTSGEQRLSNFLLLQGAYSEFYFTNTLWPDFGKQDFDQIMDEYARRNRRFGQVAAAE
jgi:undecaprenyl diphosphate synthase